MSEMAPGWYPDPEGENQQRYWDGDQWADYYQPLAPERPEPYGSETAVEDYPYLANATQPPAPPAPISTGWSAQGPTTAWGTPAPPGVYVPGQQPAAGREWNAGDPTQEFHAGATKGRGGLIAIIVTIVVVLSLLIAGGIMAYEINGNPPSPPLGAVEAVAPPAAETGSMTGSGSPCPDRPAGSRGSIECDSTGGTYYSDAHELSSSGWVVPGHLGTEPAALLERYPVD